MKPWIPHLLVIAVLATSMEGASEPMEDNTFHQTHHSHADDPTQWYPDGDGDEHDSDSCEHFCHLHAVGLFGHLSLPDLNAPNAFVPGRHFWHLAPPTAPPTPPPNA